MKSYYQEILKYYTDDEGIKNAILSNSAMIYSFMSRIVILNSTIYRNIEIKEGDETADRLLTDALIIFRRQVKNNMIEIIRNKDSFFVKNSGNELTDYLINLFLLIFEVSPLNPTNKQSHEFETKLIKGRGFEKLYELKASVLNTLHSSGCKLQDDKEEIFNESLIVFWKKLIDGEIGIYFSGNANKLDDCRVFNRKLYQNSKLNTFLTGISKNLFLNRTRTADYKVFRNDTAEITERLDIGPLPDEADNQVLIMFLYYRQYVEQRKIRTTISLLQYDCNLEDKEVRSLIGINNARIHSSRLRTHFYQWYSENLHNMPAIFDAAHEYFTRREFKKEKLNEKIRTIDLYQRNRINHVDLNKFKEEFRSFNDFTQYCRIFKCIFYFTSMGKSSGLSGLPDEKLLRTLMETYKNVIFTLPNYQTILLLLFYGAEEPDDTIIDLLKSLQTELSELDQNSGSVRQLMNQLDENKPDDSEELTNEMYKSNHNLFNSFSVEKNFINMITQNGTF